MNNKDRIRLRWIRNWTFPGQERLSRYFKPSAALHRSFKNGIIWLHKEPIALYASPDNYIEWTLLSTGSYEPEIEKLIALSLRPGDVALDIGANIGLQSLRMARYVGEAGTVLSFEPLNHLQEKFRKNMSLNRFHQVKLFTCALSDRSGEEEFTIDPEEYNQGTFSIGHTSGTGKKKQKVKILRGDDIPEITALPKLDLIKIDVEGYESDVLSGLTETVTKHKPRIIFEYDEQYWRTAGRDIAALHAFLSGLEYTFYQIESIGLEYLPDFANFRSGNIFCLPPH